jgi:hypothetical protein
VRDRLGHQGMFGDIGARAAVSDHDGRFHGLIR